MPNLQLATWNCQWDNCFAFLQMGRLMTGCQMTRCASIVSEYMRNAILHFILITSCPSKMSNYGSLFLKGTYVCWVWCRFQWNMLKLRIINITWYLMHAICCWQYVCRMAGLYHQQEASHQWSVSKQQIGSMCAVGYSSAVATYSQQPIALMKWGQIQ